jgi:iron-sulfur cluster assembly protein
MVFAPPLKTRKSKEICVIMLTVTKEAAALLRAVKAAEGAPPESGIRIRKGPTVEKSGREAMTVQFAISDAPSSKDEQLEENGLRIFVEDALIDELDGRTLDVNSADQGLKLVFR